MKKSKKNWTKNQQTNCERKSECSRKKIPLEIDDLTFGSIKPRTQFICIDQTAQIVCYNALFIDYENNWSKYCAKKEETKTKYTAIASKLNMHWSENDNRIKEHKLYIQFGRKKEPEEP